ncbi:MAG TPA: carbohydrate ABC transporter permease [Clostridiales bacterium]|nr:carbohydrate ABC transporter permease [Clostridiales bacterium]
MTSFIESIGERIFNIFNVLLMLMLAFATLYPMLYVAFASVSDPHALMKHAGLLFMPLGFCIDAYRAVFKNPMILRGYLNTLFIVIVGVGINIIFTSMGAYFLSRKNIMLKNGIMFLIAFTMFFSGGMIPFYLTVMDLNIQNTLWSLILPVAINTYNLIIMRTAFQNIPSSLEESAKIDGAGHFTILFRIIFPISLPVIAVMILYYGVEHWNSWFNAMLFLRNRELMPLQLILREIIIMNNTENMHLSVGVTDVVPVSETIKYAVIIVATIPILTLYPFLQKYFVKGVLIGALKG